MKILWLDLSAGISGDMLLGALSELAGGIGPLREAIDSIGITGLSVARRTVVRAGLGAVKVDVLLGGAIADDPGHVQPAHADHSHRTLADIAAILSASALSAPVKGRAESVFRRLVEAEAEVHGIPVDTVRLHEAGALDAIADVAGVCALLERIAPDRILASPVNVGGGFIDCAHGRYPVPGPAAALLLRGAPVFSTGEDGELATPTGAALLATISHGFGPLPPMLLRQVGAGAGTRDTSPRPNVLRAFLGEAVELPAGPSGGATLPAAVGEYPAGSTPAEIAVAECTVDDMNPQNYGWLLERLQKAGASDAWFTAVQMKKNRPGVLVTILCPLACLDAVGNVLFAETTTIGFRWRTEHRRELDRTFETVETSWGAVRVKVSSQQGSVRTAQPEYEDCRRLAETTGVPLKEIQADALDAWRRGRPAGEPRPDPPAPARPSAGTAARPGSRANRRRTP